MMTTPGYALHSEDSQVCGQYFSEPIAMEGRNESPSEASSSKYDDARRYV